MKKKYFERTGLIPFWLWVFTMGVTELETTPNKEKAETLLGKMEKFLDSSAFNWHAKQEEQADLQKLIESLKALIANM